MRHSWNALSSGAAGRNRMYLLVIALLSFALLVVLFFFPNISRNPNSFHTPVDTHSPSYKHAMPSNEESDENSHYFKHSRTELSASTQQALNKLSNRSTEGLIETPLENGGSKVNLKGRFSSVAVATVDEYGNIVISEH